MALSESNLCHFVGPRDKLVRVVRLTVFVFPSVVLRVLLRAELSVEPVGGEAGEDGLGATAYDTDDVGGDEAKGGQNRQHRDRNADLLRFGVVTTAAGLSSAPLSGLLGFLLA